VERVWVREGDPVWEGQMLLSLDSTQARQQLREAKADLAAARQQKLKVESLRKTQQDKIEQQEAAVAAARHNAAMAASEREVQKKLFDLKQSSPEQLAVHENKERALKDLVRVEEAKLKEARDFDLSHDIARAQADIDAKEAVVERARQGLLECDVYAPAEGTILRLFVSKGEALGREPKLPAIQFCPATPRIIRAEVFQEWAGKVELGQTVLVEDDTRYGPQWQGRVTWIADAFTHRRSKLLEPFQYNDVRTLECIVTLNPGQPRPLRIGQRVRVIIKQSGA
jgi:multidrug resistance efflux pump